MDWFDETLHDGIRQSLTVDRLLHREHTGRQELTIFENRLFGRVLTLDGAIQTTEADEYVYHEMLAHPAILARKAALCSGPEDGLDILIVGGGDGGCLREVLRHPEVRATQVEIDPRVVELAKTHLPALSDGAFEDPRAELVIADGARFVADTDRRFDVAIVDSTDPVGPGAALFTEDFYRNCKRCLKEGGVLITQNGVPALQGDEPCLEPCRVPQAVRRPGLLRRAGADLQWRLHGLRLGDRRSRPAPLEQRHDPGPDRRDRAGDALFQTRRYSRPPLRCRTRFAP